MKPTNHFILLLLIPALDVERCPKRHQPSHQTCAPLTNVIVATVQDRLVTSLRLTNRRKRLYDPQPQLLSLHILIHRNILYVAYLTKASEELLLDKDTTDGDDLVCGFVDYDEGEVSGGREALPVKGR